MKKLKRYNLHINYKIQEFTNIFFLAYSSMKYFILLNCAELYLQCIYRDSLISVFPWKYWYHNFRNFIFRQPVKKFSRFTYIHAFYQERCDISFTTNILYVWTHINLMFHVLSLHRSNTVFSHIILRKICWRNMTLFLLCRKRREAVCSSTVFSFLRTSGML